MEHHFVIKNGDVGRKLEQGQLHTAPADDDDDREVTCQCVQTRSLEMLWE